MPIESLEEILKTLTYHQGIVLYWTCKDLKYEDIAERYGYKKSWCVWQMSFVYHKLGLDQKDPRTGQSLHWNQRREIIKGEVCPAFMRLISDDPKNIEPFPLIAEGVVVEPQSEIPIPPPEPTPEPPQLPPGPLPDPTKPPPEGFYPVELYKAWLMVLEDEKPNGDPPPPPPPQPNWRRILILASILGCIGCLVVGVGAYRLGQGALPSVTESSILTVQALSTTEPSLTTQSTNTETPLPTDTMAPTETPFPTSTFTPTLAPTKELYEQGDPAYLKPNVYLAMNPKFGRDTFANCYAPNPGFNLVLDYVNNSTEQFSLRFDKSQFHVFDDTGKEYSVETSGIDRCDAELTLKEATISGGTNGHMYIGVSGSIGLDVKYLILKVDNISGYGPFSFKKDL